MNIPKYIEQYRKDLKLKNYAENTISNYISQLNCFLNTFDGKFSEPQKINTECIKDWLLPSGNNERPFINFSFIINNLTMLLLIIYYCISLYYCWKSIQNHLEDGTYAFDSKLETIIVALMVVVFCMAAIPAELLYFMMTEKKNTKEI